MSNFNDLCKQIKKSFKYGILFEYLCRDIKHKPEKVEKLLKSIVDGKDGDFTGDNSKMKAEILLRKLRIMIEDKTLYNK
jgi:hypothetical protein